MEQIKSLVEGGKATAGPPLGPALGPLGVPINKIIEAINEKTKNFAGMKVPVTVKVDPSTKEFEIEVGSPPVSALIKKELKIEKGSGSPKAEKVADMVIEQAIKIAMMKESSIYTRELKGAVKTVVGSCCSMGILVEGKDPHEALKDIDNGKFDEKIKARKTELSEEELKKLAEEREKMAEELAKAHEAEEAKAKDIIGQMKGKDASDIKHRLKEEGISIVVINRLMPAEGAVPAEGAAPAEGEEKKEGEAAPAEKKEEEKKE